MMSACAGDASVGRGAVTYSDPATSLLPSHRSLLVLMPMQMCMGVYMQLPLMDVGVFVD
jgi:hypothetical protein